MTLTEQEELLDSVFKEMGVCKNGKLSDIGSLLNEAFLRLHATPEVEVDLDMFVPEEGSNGNAGTSS